MKMVEAQEITNKIQVSSSTVPQEKTQQQVGQPIKDHDAPGKC